MTGILESLFAGLVGILVLILLSLVVFAVFCGVVYILHKIPSIPIRVERGNLHYEDEELFTRWDWDSFVFFGMLTVSGVAILLIIYVIGFLMIEVGGMTIETLS